MSDQQPRHYRSLFFPLLLIAIGVIWLLSNFNLLPANSLQLMLSLWPLLLIFGGLDLMFGRGRPAVSAVITILMFVTVLGFVILSPALKLPAASNQMLHRSLSEPLADTKSAMINLDLSYSPTIIRALPASSAELLHGEIDYYGGLNYSAAGSAGEKTIRLSSNGLTGFNLFPIGWTDNPQWLINLNPNVPLALEMNAGSGSGEYDLSGLDLASFSLDAGSGSTKLTLPGGDNAYEAHYSGGSGSLDLTLPADGSLTLYVSTGSGSASLLLPAGAAARLEIQDDGSGSVSVSSSLVKQPGSDRDDTGIWETAGYAQAKNKINIVFTGVGSGSISIR